MTITYHTEIFRRFLTELGYIATPINEATAVVYAECEDTGLTALSLDFGAGMSNIALVYKGLDVFSFSVAKCLDGGTLVCTDQGYIKIKDIDPKLHRVVDSFGRLCRVNEKIYNGTRTDLVEFSTVGLCIKRKLTADHKILVKNNINWEWKEAKDLKITDIVGEPVVNCTAPIKQYYIGNRTLNTGDYLCIKPQAGRNLGKFIGIFLGDGNASYVEDGAHYQISIAFNKTDAELINKYETCIKTLFPFVNIRRYVKDMVHSIIFTDKTIAHKLKTDFYTKTKEKVLPIPLDTIPNNMAMGIIEGLLDSDGYITDDQISFCNTSSQVMWVLRQLLGRFGISGTLQIRPPRKGQHLNNKGKPIIARKTVYEFKIGTKYDVTKLVCMMSDYDGHDMHTKRNDFIETMVNSISISNNVAADVYDLFVDSDQHSFSLPYVTVHNCGDFIDRMVSESRGIPISDATAEKEKPDFNLLEPKDDIEEAITIFYKNTLEYVLEHTVIAMEQHKNNIKLSEPLSVVIAGGTSMPKGFLQLLTNALKENPLPIPVGKVWQAQNPVMAVCKGCLRVAQKALEDPKTDGVTDISNGKNLKHQYPTAVKEEAVKEKTPKEKRDDVERAKVLSQGVSGFAESIDISKV